MPELELMSESKSVSRKGGSSSKEVADWKAESKARAESKAESKAAAESKASGGGVAEAKGMGQSSIVSTVMAYLDREDIDGAP